MAALALESCLTLAAECPGLSGMPGLGSVQTAWSGPRAVQVWWKAGCDLRDAHSFPFNSPRCLPHPSRRAVHLPAVSASCQAFLAQRARPRSASDTLRRLSSLSCVTTTHLMFLVDGAGGSPFLTSCASSGQFWIVGGERWPISNGVVACPLARSLTNQGSWYSCSWVFPCFESGP